MGEKKKDLSIREVQHSFFSFNVGRSMLDVHLLKLERLSDNTQIQKSHTTSTLPQAVPILSCHTTLLNSYSTSPAWAGNRRRESLSGCSAFV